MTRTRGSFAHVSRLGLASLLCAGLMLACGDDSGPGPGDDAATNNNNGVHPDASLLDATTDAGPADAAVDAWVRPEGDAYVLPENPHDAFVHPTLNFGPAMVIDTLAIQNSVDGLGPFAGVVNGDIQDALEAGQLLMVIEFLDLNGTTGVIDDSDVTLVMYRATDADADLTNNFTGAGEFLVDLATATVIAGVSIAAGQVAVPAGTFPYLSVNIPGLGELVIMDPDIVFTVGNDFTGLSAGEIAGAVPSRTLDLLANETGFGNPNGSVLDFLATSVFEVQPDVDIDGDGQLETYEDVSPLSPGIDEMISVCHDYFGTFDDDECPQYPEIWDGYSVVLEFTAVPCTITGAVP